jgi:hypothetical protein
MTRDQELDAMFHQYQEQQEASVKALLSGVPPEGGSVSRDILEAVLRAAFRDGVIAALEVKSAIHNN